MSDIIFKPPKTDLDQTVKKDAGKPRMDLIPTSALKSLANVLTFGCSKYGENTWQEVEIKRYKAALLRHFVAWADEPLGKDEESGLYHSEHLLWNAMAINDWVVRGAKENKSFEKPNTVTFCQCFGHCAMSKNRDCVGCNIYNYVYNPEALLEWCRIHGHRFYDECRHCEGYLHK